MKNKKISFYAFAAVLIIAATLLFVLVFSPGVSSSVLNPIPNELSGGPLSNTTQPLENPDYSKIEINKENVQSVIAEMSRPTQYYHETVSTIHHTSGSKRYPRKKWSNGTQQRIDVIAENGTTDMTVIHSGKYTYMWRPGHTRYYRANSGSFSADSTQMIMVYEDILKLATENITDAKFTLYNSIPCVYVEAVNPQTKYRSRYWVSSETGLLAYGQTLDSSNNVIYTVEATQTFIDTQDPSLFLLPNGETALSE